MTHPMVWRRIWDRVQDYEYLLDCKVFEYLSAYDGTIRDGMADAISAALGNSTGTVDASFKRLIWNGALKFVSFTPPSSTYRLTRSKGYKVRRAPLGGRRFRSPTQVTGDAWGRPVGATSYAGRSGVFAEAVGHVASAFTKSRDGPSRGSAVPIAAIAPEPAFDLTALLEGMHPKVRALCLELADGATIDEAREACGLTAQQVDIVIPRLRTTLSELMRAA